MQGEVVRVVIVQADDDYQRNTLTMLKEQNGKFVFHRKLDRSKIIDGEDLIVEVKKESPNG